MDDRSIFLVYLSGLETWPLQAQVNATVVSFGLAMLGTCSNAKIGATDAGSLG